MDETFISKRLTQLRIQKDVSARDMSLSIGQANNYINNIENRKALPSMQALFLICDYFGITPQEFFDEGNACPEQLKGLMGKLKKLNPHRLAHIESLVDDLNEQK